MKIKKILKWLSIIIGALLFIGVGYVYFVWLAKPASVNTFAEIKDREWRTVNLGDECMCSDGSEYFLFVRKGNSSNLLIHFSGGGACWDDFTCTNPNTIYKALTQGNSKDLKAFYYPVVYDFFSKFLKGVFDNTNESNPFRDWNIVYIPYCTGDLHIGNKTMNYKTEDGDEMEVHHNGQTNVTAALDWIYANFGKPEKILVSGESAGGFASAYWAPFVANHYIDHDKIYQLSDGSQLTSKRWPAIIDTVWNSNSESFFHFKIEDDAYTDVILNRLDSANTRIKHLNSNTLYDVILPRFYAVLNHRSTDQNDYIYNWSDDMRNSIQKLSNSNIDYQYFLTECQYDSVKVSTPHTLMAFSDSTLYHFKTEGISYADWLRRNVIEDDSISVGSSLLNLPEE